MNRRLKLAKHWLLTNKNNVDFKEIIRNVFDSTCDVKAKPFIKNITEKGEFYTIEITGLKHPLYYPTRMPLQALYQVISESFYPEQWHYYEIPETTVSSTDVVLDCGAAEGMFSLMIMDRCKHVYAIEPLPIFITSLNKSFEGFSNVSVLPLALSDVPGKAFMDDNSIASSVSDSGNTEISLDTVDNLFFKNSIKVDYLKADLEGFEMSMLRGAAKTIAAYKPKIAITTYHKAEHADEIEGFLKEINPNYNFKLKGIEERAGAPVMLHAWDA